LQHMREYLDKERDLNIREEERRKLLGETIRSNKPDEDVAEKTVNFSPTATKNQFNKAGNTVSGFGQTVKTGTVGTIKGLSLLRKDSIEEEREKLGRYWIWENYCDDDFKERVIEPAV
jgi:hypothetical protein